jgi:hypothetical protein
MSSAGTIKHRKVTALPDNPNFDVSSSEWNDSLVVGGGTQSQVMVRDAGQLDGWGWSSSVPLTDVTASDHISIGTTPATTGALRLANNQAIVWRNAANSGDIAPVIVNASNQLALGGWTTSIIAHTGLTPATDNTTDLGTTSLRWRNLFVGTSAKVDKSLQLTEQTFASVPAGQPIGTIANISDSQSTVSGDVVVGGGASHVLARYNGTNWVVISTPQGGVGNVTGPGTATVNDLAIFSTTNGQVLADSGILAANVARRDVANTFTVPQTLSGGAQADLRMYDPNQPADSRVFRIWNSSQTFFFDTTNDAVTVAQTTPLQLTRPGDAKIYRDLYEKQRSTPIGHWIDVPFNASNFMGTAGMTWTVASGDVYANRYTLIGKTLVWQFQLNASTIGGTVSPYLTMTTPVASNNYFYNAPTSRLITGGAPTGGNIQFGGSNLIQIAKNDSSPFAAGSLTLMFTLIAPIP